MPRLSLISILLKARSCKSELQLKVNRRLKVNCRIELGWPAKAKTSPDYNSLVHDRAGPSRERHHRRQSLLFTRCPNSRLQKRMTTFGAWPKTNEEGWKKLSA